MSSLRDTVARRSFIASRHSCGDIPGWDNLSDVGKAYWREIADIALAAIREQYAIVPRNSDKAICAAGNAVVYIGEDLYPPIYRAMIAVGEVKE